MKVLVTGFAPFGGEERNPSFEAVRLLPREIAGAQVVAAPAPVPVAFGAGAETVRGLIVRERPQIVVCAGQAGGRAEVSVERVAINLADARIPDAAGFCPRERPILPGGPAACFSTLPVTRMAEAIRARGVPARVSLSAGSFVCNDLFYRLLAGVRAPGGAGGLYPPALLSAAGGRKARRHALPAGGGGRGGVGRGHRCGGGSHGSVKRRDQFGKPGKGRLSPPFSRFFCAAAGECLTAGRGSANISINNIS